MKRKRVLAVLLAASMVVCNLPVWAANTETGPDDESKAVIEEEAESPSEKAEDTTQSESVTDGNPENDEEIAENSDTETDGTNKENAEQQKNDIEGKKQNLDENIKESPQVLSEGDSEISIPDPALLQVILAKTDDNQNGKVEKSEIENLWDLIITENDIPDGQDTLDLEGIGNAENLMELSIIMSENRRLTIQNLEELESIKELLYLTINFCNFTDMEWLTKMYSCAYLGLQDNKITELPGLDKLNVTRLYLDNNEITNIEPAILGCDSLSELSLSGNKITSFPKMERVISYINLSNNEKLMDISNLSSFMDKEGYKYVDLSLNPQLNRTDIIKAALGLKDISLEIREIYRLEKINNKIQSINMDGGNADLKYQVEPADVLQIEEGVLKPKKTGEAMVTVTTDDFSGSFNVKITRNDERVIFADEDIINAPDIQACDTNLDGIITKEELKALQSLDLNLSKGTIDFAGLENAVNLSSLSVVFGPSGPITKVDNTLALSSLVNMNVIRLNGLYLADLSFLSGMPDLDVLELNSCQIDDKNEIDNILEKATNLSSLTYTYGGLTEVPNMSKLDKLRYLDLSGNNISDISPIASMPLVSIDLYENNISFIPEWINYSKLDYLNLGGNPLKDYKNLKPLLDMSIFVVAYRAGITSEEQYEEFFNNSKRSMYMGNKADIYVGKWIDAEENVDITYSSENENALAIEDNRYLLAKMPGTFTVTAKCKSIEKSFEVFIDNPETPVTIKRKDMPEINHSDRQYCSILETDSVLWSYNKNKIEKVMENVKSYVRDDTEFVVNNQTWLNYLVLDKNKTLWKCEKKDANSSYTAVKVAENITEYNTLNYMDEEHNLYDTKDGKKIAENVNKYRYGYYSTGSQVRYIYTMDCAVIDIISDKVLMENVDDCYFDRGWDLFICIKDKKATWYKLDGKEIAAIDNVKAVDSEERLVITGNGDTIKYFYDAGGEKKLSFLNQKDVIPKMPFKSENYGKSVTDYKLFVLDANNVLWSKPYEEDDKSFEKVADNVKQLFNDMNNVYYLKDNILYNASEEKVYIKDVDSVNPLYLERLMLYIKTDGTLYESDFYGCIENKILSNVKYMYTGSNPNIYSRTYTCTYIVREDGSVWKYDTMRQTNAVAKQIKAGREAGDIDGDGKIEVRDMLQILQTLSGSQSMKPEDQKKADIDGDGKVTIKDVLRVLHFVSGQSSAL